MYMLGQGFCINGFLTVKSVELACAVRAQLSGCWGSQASCWEIVPLFRESGPFFIPASRLWDFYILICFYIQCIIAIQD